MKVVIAAGGRFHAFHLAHQLEKRNALKNLFTFAYSKKDQNYISSNLVLNNNFCKNLDFLYSKLRLSKIIDKSNFNIFKDNKFDCWLGKRINKLDKIDIFVGWAHYFLNSYSKIKKTGAKIIVECGSTHILEQQDLLKEEYKRFNVFNAPINPKNVNKILEEYKKSDYIMTCSGFTYNSYIKHGIPAEKVLRIPYGVNLDFFLDEKENKKDKFRVICVGLMCLRKGIPYLIDAWKKLNLPEKETELLLVGNIQKDLNQVLKNVTLPKNIIFYGSTGRDNLKKLYKGSSLFVLPSIEEGLSMTIAEAMASGLPVICTTNTGGQDLIEDEKHGFITPIRNVDAIAEKILWCYKNRERSQEMGKLGQQKVKNFTWDHYGEKVFNCYKKILKQS